jgi:hypothetical protein
MDQHMSVIEQIGYACVFLTSSLGFIALFYALFRGIKAIQVDVDRVRKEDKEQKAAHSREWGLPVEAE